MSIILNELTWAENAIREKMLGKKPYETILRVSKYYVHKGLSKKDARSKVEAFILSCDPSFPIHKWSDPLDGIIKTAFKKPIVILDGISVSKDEMDRIEKIEGKQARRLAFTLLCIAKYNVAVDPNTNYWVSTPDNEILRMANISTSVPRQCALFRQLRDNGFIQFSKQIDNLSVRVLFANDGEPAITITDFRNIGYQYMRYYGEPYFVCAHCGITSKRNNPGVGRKQKYCNCCATEIRVKNKVNSVMNRDIPISK